MARDDGHCSCVVQKPTRIGPTETPSARPPGNPAEHPSRARLPAGFAAILPDNRPSASSHRPGDKNERNGHVSRCGEQNPQPPAGSWLKDCTRFAGISGTTAPVLCPPCCPRTSSTAKQFAPPVL